MFYIHLFRVKCESLPQGDFLRVSRDTVDVISKSIEAKPTAEVGRRSEWHIGNVEPVKGGGIAFAMGRTQAVTSPKFDSVSHDFLEEEAMKAPFTVGVFDTETQACGVIRKSGVSQSSTEVASKLEVLLNAAPYARESNSRIIVEPIPDPVTFIDAIRRAKAVTRFSFTVTRPNPHDINRLIQKPAEEFTEAADGEKAKVEVEGSDLNRDLIEDVAHAVAAVGESAAANIIPEDGSRTKRVHLSGNAVVEPVETGDKISVFAAILDRTRAAYARIRNSEGR
ncbi:hypothetical protein J2Y54_003179 [Sphingomonas sp. BE123]|uniref:hypothetical protein n=1 Tax=unclassified Sphingomonas TaxID=196159 RepID=UPI0028639655|nr:hypothetical protein [Sphingomonas sp. BE123]MDR6853659.1 hypothetical protein [Sphingomonas sp. BE123]